MGRIIYNGKSVWTDELSGSVNFSQLIDDICCEDYTVSYRYLCIRTVFDNLSLFRQEENALRRLLQVMHRLTEMARPDIVISIIKMMGMISSNFRIDL